MFFATDRPEHYAEFIGLDPLYEAAHILTKEDNTPQEEDDLRVIASPIVNGSIDIIKVQFNPTFPGAGARRILAVCDYALSIVESEEDTSSTVYWHTAETGESIFVGGYLQYITFGYDLDRAVKRPTDKIPFLPHTGLWLHLMPTPDDNPEDINTEFVVQLPHAKLLSADIIQN